MRSALQLAALVIATVACAADPVPLTACTAGVSTACTCSSGATGAQVCRADGSGFGACVCTGGDAGADAVAVGDAGPDVLPLDVAGDADDSAVPDAPDGGPGRCPGSLPMCNGVCMPLHDARNCGRCGVSCSDGWVCMPAGMFGECVPPDAGTDTGG